MFGVRNDSGGTLQKCNEINATLSFFRTEGYDGIPETLLVNVVSWIVLLGLFTILRKRAWNYGQIALVQKTDEKWMQLFYNRVGNKNDQQDTDPNVSVASVESVSATENRFRNWLLAVFKIKDDNILQKCGPDALQYLSFQRHIMAYMFIVTVITISVVLPVNMTGKIQPADSLGQTTINNLDADSKLLWIHATLAFAFLPLLIYIVRRFSIKLKVEEEDHAVSRTLMISNIPRRYCDKEDLKRHFREAYPETEIQDIQLAYDVSKVNNLHEARARTCAAIKYCDNHLRKTGQRLTIRPYVCGNLCSCCCGLCNHPSVDALEFYLGEEQILRDKLDGAKNRSLQRPLGIAFITLSSLDDAKSIYYEHQRSQLCGSAPATSSLSNQLETHHWTIAFAPAPQDIKWENLSTSTNYWYLKVILVNVFLFVVLFFMTTPAIVLQTLRKINFINSGIDSMSHLISDFLPTLMLWTVAVIMPVIVSYSDRWMNHWTRSECNRSIMNKTFYFLLFMVLILPSLELTSIDALLGTLKNKSETVNWDCIFLPSKGAFFINYVTTSAFIGTTLELIRFPELFCYVLLLSLAKSKAESGSVRRSVIREFQFGENYAWFLLIFTISITYSLSCPLIMPFGLAYMVLKHLVDRYNLFFAYNPSNISQNIHASAITNVIIAVILPQIQIFLLFFVHKPSQNDFVMYCSLIGFILTLVVYLSHWMFQCCRGFSPFAYQPKSPNSSQQSTPKREISAIHKFVPDVLQPGGSPALQHIERSSQQVGLDLSSAQRSYGTNKSDVETMSSDDVVRVVPPESPSELPLNSPLYQAYEESNREA